MIRLLYSLIFIDTFRVVSVVIIQRFEKDMDILIRQFELKKKKKKSRKVPKTPKRYARVQSYAWFLASKSSEMSVGP